MVLSFFGVGFLPLVDGGDAVAKVLPGTTSTVAIPSQRHCWGHMALLGGGSVLLLLAASLDSIAAI